MQTTLDIGITNLVTGYFLLIIPLAVFWYFRTGLIKDTLFATGRMTIQLVLVAIYLEYIFSFNDMYINMAWVLIMLIVTTYTTIRRSNLSFKVFTLPVFISTTVSVILILSFFIGVVIQLDYFFESRYFIPIAGILLGNTLRTNVIALNTYYSEIKKETVLYRFYLANGATRNEALKPFMRDALKMAFNPFIANISVVGLINLPGIMTGQILGGSDPAIAIKYQIMFLITIFAAAIITVFLTVYLSNSFVFDRYDNMDKKIFRKER